MDVIDAEIVPFLESGCGLIVGAVDPDGEPHAARGWGLTVGPGVDPTVRLLVDADDPIASWDAIGALAITAADVRTYRSLQLKGRVTRVEPGTDEDRSRARRFNDDFFTDIHETDGTPMATLERLVPSRYVAFLVVIDELFDQTPGPRAGALVGPGRA